MALLASRARPVLTTNQSSSTRAVSLLPEVKCTSCGRPVPLDELGDHECAPARKPSPAPSSVSASSAPSSVTSRVSKPPSISRSLSPSHAPTASRSLSASPTPAPSSSTRTSPGRAAPDESLRTLSRSMSPSPSPSSRSASISSSLVRPNIPLPSSPEGESLSPTKYSNERSRSLSTTTPTTVVSHASPPRHVLDPPSTPPPPETPVDVPQVNFPPYTPDTKSGGQAGMAGVGRRAFAAAAHAAFLSTSRHITHGSVSTIGGSHTPQYLDVNSMGGRGTPALSTPRSTPSPHPPGPRTPSPGMYPPHISSPMTSMSSPTRKTSFDRESEGSETELAYVSYLGPESKTSPPPARSAYSKDSIAFPSNSKSRRSQSSATSSTSYTSPMPIDDDQSSSSGSSERPTGLHRSDTLASVSVYSATSGIGGRRISKSTGAIGKNHSLRPLETLTEEETPSSATARARELAAKSSSSTEPLHIPSRSKTTPPRTGEKTPTTRRKRTVKTCVRCNKLIDDGRWIAIDQGAGGVLCEKDWKEMYLPKCRRCGLTIESQAVSSADGQLKGKYHRACFNCSTCQKPFPDRSFYVYGGQPYCDYHYHLANNSLCASPSCGRPIEGPCAEDHEGKRYHPEHLICEEDDCGERLVDYYDVDGRKYCERHVDFHRTGSTRLSSVAEESDEEEPSVPEKESSYLTPTTRAQKRRTRFLEI